MARDPRVSIIIAAKNLAGRVFDEVRTGAKRVAGELKGAFSGVRGVLAALGAAVGGFSLAKVLSGAVKEAREAERASIDLRGSVQNLGLSYDALKPQLDATIDRLADLAALDDEEVSDALSNLITKTGDLGGALEHLPLALGIARKEKISLAEASDKVAKVMNGQTRAAKELGVTTTDTSAALAALHTRYGSFATDDSTTGILTRIRNAWNNVLEAVGDAIFGNDRLKDSLQGIADRLAGAQRWVREHRDELGRFAGALAAVLERLLHFAGVVVRVTVALVGFATRHKEATLAVGASVGTFWLLNTALAALGATSIPRLLVVLRQLRRAFTAISLTQLFNPMLLGLAAVSAAIGAVVLIARSGQRELTALREAMGGMTDVALGMAWNKQAAELRTARQQLEEARSRAATAQADQPRLATAGGDPTLAIAAAARGSEVKMAERAVALQRRKLDLIEEEFRTRGEIRAQMAGVDVTIPDTRGGGAEGDATKKLEQRIRLLGEALEVDETRAAASRELARVQAELTSQLRTGLLAEQERLEIAGRLRQIEAIRARDLDAQVKRYTELTEHESTRARGLEGLADLETKLQGELARTTLTLDQRAEKERQLAAVRKAQNEAQQRELDQLLALADPEELRLRRTQTHAEALARLVDLQREITEALRQENAALAAGAGNLERVITLRQRLADIDARIGPAPQAAITISDGETPATSPKPADRIESPFLKHPELRGPKPEQLTETQQALQEALARTIGLTDDATAKVDEYGVAWATAAGAGVGAFVDTALQGFEKVGAGQASLGKAFGQAIRAGIAEAARSKASFYLAEATASLGQAFLGHPGALLAAGKFFAAAAAFSALAGAAAGGRSGGGAAPGLGLTQDTVQRTERGTVYVQFPAGKSYWDTSDPETEREWKRAIEDLTGRDVVILRGGATPSGR